MAGETARQTRPGRRASRRRRLAAAAIISTVAAMVSVHVDAAPARAAAAHRHQRVPRPPTPLDLPQGTRLLVVAPHPDDEVLGAGGLMRRVEQQGGNVRIVYLTDGEGYPEGVALEDHGRTPTPDDFRGYGVRREKEARSALAELKLRDYALAFLNFPDGGLSSLMRSYWSERRAAYRSPYTRRDRPPLSNLLVPSTEYRGEDLTQELAQVIGDFRPTVIAVPRKEDQHADHCAAWFFVADALTDVRRVHPDYSADVLNYIIHWYSWPFEDEGRTLPPPPRLRGGASGWMTLALSHQDAQAKKAALGRYRTQMHVMSWFLDGFVRDNELFSRPASSSVRLPSRRDLCTEP